jgi:hypothetical protein
MEIKGKRVHLQENMDMKLTCWRVRGADITIPISVTMTAKTAVHNVWPDRVFKTFAPVRMWKPMSRMLFARSMKAEKT